jgi:Right handed beta helix region
MAFLLHACTLFYFFSKIGIRFLGLNYFMRKICYSILPIAVVLFSVIALCNKALAWSNSKYYYKKAIVKSTVLPVTYYVQPLIGSDTNSGTSIHSPFKTLAKIGLLKLHAGDKVVLAAGVTYEGCIKLIGLKGTLEQPITVTSINWSNGNLKNGANINFKGLANGILIQDCSYVNVSNINLTANGYGATNEISDMRCGLLINSVNETLITHIKLSNLLISDVYYENKGFVRDKDEVKSANGTQKYGWGIRIISKQQSNVIENVDIDNCDIFNVSHTGIKLTGNKKNIKLVNIVNNTVNHTGGPGIQMSEVQFIYVANNIVDHSGSNTDSRKWGRGSGLWTWGASDVLIEKNQFLNANGPGDSNGAHIDYNCNNIIIQYNFSANNAGGFCEVLGNNYNSVYRYNISVNDGYRVKGKNGAFQEGKILWLSGYQGNNQPRKGPFNTYIYNNTIYVDATLQPKLAFTNTCSGVLIANNIFYSSNPFQLVLGDQNKADLSGNNAIANMCIANNLFLKVKSLPVELEIYERNTLVGNPAFKNGGGLNIKDYIPQSTTLIKGKGLVVAAINASTSSDRFTLQLAKDILGKPIASVPSIGAIEINN